MIKTHSSIRALSVLTGACVVLTLVGCVEAPPPAPVPPPPPRVALNTQVYAYPLQNQSPDQQGKDRYECSLWATQQTGFDPSASNVPPDMRVRVAAGPPPGTNTALGAITGAIIGAAVGGPRNGAATTLFGAVAGAAVGSAADQENAHATREVYVRDHRAIAQMQQKASDYRRAIGACLEARGYSVR